MMLFKGVLREVTGAKKGIWNVTGAIIPDYGS